MEIIKDLNFGTIPFSVIGWNDRMHLLVLQNDKYKLILKERYYTRGAHRIKENIRKPVEIPIVGKDPLILTQGEAAQVIIVAANDDIGRIRAVENLFKEEGFIFAKRDPNI